MRLVIFGAGDFAEICHHYFTRYGKYDVSGFVVDDGYHTQDALLGLPVLPSSRLGTAFPPDSHHLFVAIGYRDGNRLRQAKCEQMRAFGYTLATFVHPSAVSDGLSMGDNCLISENAVVQPFARLGSGVVVRAGSIVGHHSSIGSYCYLAPGVIMSGFCEIGNRAFLGTGALLRDRVSVAADCSIGIGAVLTRNAEVAGSYIGHPAQLMAGRAASPRAKEGDSLTPDLPSSQGDQ